MGARGTAQDRWLISYADFITLLFATFVLMYVAAKNQAMHPAAGGQGTASGSKTSVAASVAQPAVSGLTAELMNTLSLERANHSVNLSKEPRGLIITLDDNICFDEGQADVRSAAMPIFQKIAGILAHYSNHVLLQGHTDSTPIHTERFHSNWELSTARSIAVMQLMEQQAQLGPERFLVAGAADNAPVSNNDTQRGRAQNRRVDIVILDDAANAQASLVLADPHSLAAPPGH